MRFDPQLGIPNAPAINTLLRTAFPAPFEANLVHSLRDNHSCEAEHGLWDKETLVGYIAYSPVTAETNPLNRKILGIGPMALAPAYQGQGHGKVFLAQSLSQVEADAFVLLGHVGFYKQVGFSSAAGFDLRFGEDPRFEAAFMAIEACAGSLDTVSGKIQYHSAFYSK